jgi:hypothetical protein
MKNVIGKQIPIASFPVKNLVVPVDVPYAQQNIAGAKDSIPSEVILQIPEGKNILTLDQITILNIIATTNWKRPIYFTSPYSELGLAPYLRKEGLVYRFVPFANTDRTSRWTYHDRIADILNKFRSGGAADRNIYVDEENRRHLLSIRSAFAEGSIALSSKGDKPGAVNLLNKSESLIRPEILPYAMVSRYNSHNQIGLLYLDAAYKAGHAQLAEKLHQAIRKDIVDQKNYYDYLRTEKPAYFSQLAADAQENEQFLSVIDNMKTEYTKPKAPVENPARGQASDTK